MGKRNNDPRDFQMHGGPKKTLKSAALMLAFGILAVVPLVTCILTVLFAPPAPAVADGPGVAWERFWSAAQLPAAELAELSVSELVARHALTPELAARVWNEGFPVRDGGVPLRHGEDYEDVLVSVNKDCLEGAPQCEILARLSKDGKPVYMLRATMRRTDENRWLCDGYTIEEA